MALLITNKQLQINLKNILNTVKFSLFVSVTKNIAKNYPFFLSSPHFPYKYRNG